MTWTADRDRLGLGAFSRAPTLVVIVGMDGALRPATGADGHAALDGTAVRVLEALAESGVQVVIASDRDRDAIDPLRGCAPRAWWAAESGAWRHAGAWVAAADGLVDWIRAARPDARVIAVGDVASELVAVRADDAATRVPLGPYAARQLLWWLVEERGARVR
jgi:hypothetical protein